MPKDPRNKSKKNKSRKNPEKKAAESSTKLESVADKSTKEEPLENNTKAEPKDQKPDVIIVGKKHPEPLSPIQKKLLGLLKEVKAELDKNGIEYVACGGTMLGAVRELGFIPWDDDIDLYIARPYYDKLLQVAKDHKFHLGKLYVASGELKNSRLPFCKIFDKDQRVSDQGVDGDEDYLYIDVFPLDGIPDSSIMQHKYAKKLEKMCKPVEVLRYTSEGLSRTTNNKFKLFLKRIARKHYQNQGSDKYLDAFIDEAKKYPYESAKYIWTNSWGPFYDVKLTKEDIKPVLMPFEDTTIKVMSGYDKFMSVQFGDYMKRPKVKISHDLELEDK